MLICEFKTFKALWKKQATDLSTECKLGGEGTVTTEKYTQTHTLNTHPHELGPENTQGMQWDRWDL